LLVRFAIIAVASFCIFSMSGAAANNRVPP